MRAFSVRLSTISPLAIRADHALIGANMTSYIPGSSFVGGLAAVHRSLYKGKEQEFARFFLNTKVLYPDLYPANFDELANSPEEPVYPLPRTAISCKRHPGFLTTRKKTTEQHGAQDTLCSWVLFSLSDMKRLEALDQQKKCPHCKESMDRFAGYYRRALRPSPERKSSQELMHERATDNYTRLQTRTGINRETGTVEEGILYNRMVFEEDAQFWGQIMLPDDDELYNNFSLFVEKIGDSQMVRLGTGRTRGLGKVALTIERLYDESNEQERFAQFRQRLAALNQLIHKQAKNILKHEHDFFFAVTLHAPLILRDELLRYRGSLDEKALKGILGQGIPGLKLIYQSAGTKRVTGWYELWGTPRINEYAIETGSVFLFRCAGEPDEKLEKTLFQLEEQGIGQRRAEGFGRICISDAFHSEGQR